MPEKTKTTTGTTEIISGMNEKSEIMTGMSEKAEIITWIIEMMTYMTEKLA